MKVVSLIENTCDNKSFKSEHGLSMYIEKDDKRYLLDTGASGDFIDNAKKLNIDLTKLDAVIISHNHFDHIGGLERLLKLNDRVKVYIKTEAKHQYYKKVLFSNICISDKNHIFAKYEDRFTFIDKNLDLEHGVQLLSNEVENKDFFCKAKSLLKKENNTFLGDDFKHELFMAVIENNEITILSSCSHNGIVNIVATVKKLYPNMPIKAIVGGFHMKGAIGMNSINCSEKYINDVANKLKEFNIKKIYTCHCTGMKAFNIMKSSLKDNIEYFATGDTIILI